MSATIYNKTSFELTIDRLRNGTQTQTNLLPGHRWYVEETTSGDQLIVRLFIDQENVVKRIHVGDDPLEIEIVNSDLRPNVDRTAQPGGLGIPENILCDLYTVNSSGAWTLDSANINPNAASFINVRPGELYVGIAKGQSVARKDEVHPLFWVYTYDPGGPKDPFAEEIGYNAHVERNYLRGNVSSNGNHVFEDPRVTEKRLLIDGKPRLFEGEVLVYESPNYDQGAPDDKNFFWIFNGNMPDVSIYAPPIDQGNNQYALPSITGRSLIPGPNTAVTFYSQANYTGSAEEEDTQQNDVRVNSLQVHQVIPSSQAGLRMTVDVSEDVDAHRNPASYARTTFALDKYHKFGNDFRWPRMRFQSQSATTGYINDGASATSLSPRQWSSYFTPNHLGRVKVCQPSQGHLHFPALFIQTETMDINQVVAFHPDIALHQRLQEKLGSGNPAHAIKNNRSALGIQTDANRLPDKACDDVQKAIVHLSKVAMTSLSQDKNAVHATQRFNGLAMPDKHWILARGAGGHPAYTAYTADAYRRKIDDIAQAVGGIQNANQNLEQGFWDWIRALWNDLRHIAISVAKAVGNAVQHAVEAVVHYVEQGIEKAVRFVITTAEHIGHLITTVLKAIKLAVQKVIDFIKFVVAGIETIGPTYHALKNATTKRLNGWRTYVDKELATDKVHHFIDGVKKNILTSIGEPQLASHPKPTHPHQTALEKLEWILGKIMSFIEGGGGAIPGGATTELIKITGDIITTVTKTVTDVEQTLANDITHPQKLAPALRQLGGQVISDVMDGLEKVADDAVGFVKKEVDALDDLIEGKYTWDVPLVSDLYKLLTGDKLSPLSVTCLLFAVPTGIVFHAEGIDPDSLELDNDVTAEKILAIMADFFNAVTAPATTFALSDAKLPPPVSLVIAMAKTVTTTAGAAAGLGSSTALPVKVLKTLIAVRGWVGLVLALEGKKGALEANLVMDMLLGVGKILVAGVGYPGMQPKTRLILGLEGTGWLLEAGGLAKQIEVSAGFAVAEGLLFGGAAVARAA